jgi:thiosulfate dehydrogenase (quinone) large subunit
MSEADKTKDSCCCKCDYSLAFLLLRGWLGIRALVTGIEKYAATRTIQKPLIDPTTGMEDPSGAMVDIAEKYYACTNYHAIPPVLHNKFALEPLLPSALTSPFYAILGPLLILLGVTTLIGLGTRISLFVQGAVYIMLTVGLILIKEDGGVAWLAIHILLIAAALVLAKHNTLAVDGLCGRLWRKKA